MTFDWRRDGKKERFVHLNNRNWAVQKTSGTAWFIHHLGIAITGKAYPNAQAAMEAAEKQMKEKGTA